MRPHFESIALSNVAVLHFHDGRYEEARTLFTDALLLRRQSILETDPAGLTAVAMSCLVVIIKKDLSFHRLSDCMTAISLTAHTSLDDLAADILFSLAAVHEMVCSKDARRFYEECRVMKEALHGAFSVPAANCLQSLATLIASEDQLDDAEYLLGRALDIYIIFLGEEHADTATVLNNLAVVCAKKSDYLRAHRFLQRAVKIRKKIFGESHMMSTFAMHNLDYVASKLFFPSTSSSPAKGKGKGATKSSCWSLDK